MHDVGGCRAILPSIEDVSAVVSEYNSSTTRHTVARHYDYVLEPKHDGYRCHHLVVKFEGRGASEFFNGRKIEMQVRSQLQHAWATAVEAVGLYRGEDLKAGLGNPDWLRFFQLVSAEFASQEGMPIVPGTPDSWRLRRLEMSDLNRRLNLVQTLSNFSEIVRFTDDVESSAEYFIIEFDRTNRIASIRPHHQFERASEEYIEEEQAIADKRLENVRNAVLVQADRIEDLKAAYPNYFLDVKLFLQQLRGTLALEAA
jgi:hypothetical protein